jgi:hypothetical protein
VFARSLRLPGLHLRLGAYMLGGSMVHRLLVVTNPCLCQLLPVGIACRQLVLRQHERVSRWRAALLMMVLLLAVAFMCATLVALAVYEVSVHLPGAH